MSATAAALPLGAWHVEPGVLLGLVTWSLGYTWLATRRWRVRRRFAPLRAASFATGVLLIGVALCSPLDATADDGSLTAHMLQHELLGLLGPALLVLGLDAQLTAPVTRLVIRPALRGARSAVVLRALTSPRLALGAYVGVSVLWSLPGGYALAADNELAHVAAHASLISAGCLLWLATLQPLPSLHRCGPWTRVLLLGCAGALGATVAAALIWLPAPLYDAQAPDVLGLGVTADQRLAGALMMAVEMPLLLGAAAWAVVSAAARTRLPVLFPTPLTSDTKGGHADA
ncbi:MAG TPA: cytochrome c oxidase assembly protein [Conexibacter sp.]|nr:cytochrome c oxidase assembly protein [Conexibacter sp.]